MKAILLVALGGALGSVARFKLSGLVLHLTPGWRFPLGTFTVNVLGCLVAGVLVGLAEKHDLLSPDARLLLFTGVLGGFTTFSAFSFDVFMLYERGALAAAIGYVLVSVVGSILALFAAVFVLRAALS